MLLRALSAFEVYRRVYRDVITPYKVAQLLILRDDMPRSLLRCCKEVYQNLKSVRTNNRPRPSGAQAKCMPCCISRAWRTSPRDGLPRFLEQFLDTAARSGRSHRVRLPGPPGWRLK